MRRAARARLGLTSLALVAMTVLAVPAPAGAGVSRTTRRLAPGVTFVRISDPSGPYEIRVLRVDPARAVMVDVTIAAKSFGAFATTSAIAKAHGALAAVNGDFALWPGRPVHTFARDGTLMATGSPDVAFAISQDERHVFADHVSPTITATVQQTGKTLPIRQWNTDAPTGDDIDAYTSVGAGVAPVPQSGCFARLLTAGGPHLGPGAVGVVRTYTVDAVSCQNTALPLAGGTVLAARRGSLVAAPAIQALVPGQTVSLTWSLGWADVASAVGGAPLLMQGGKVVAKSCSDYFCDRNPRTGIGVTGPGTILLVTVDGRQPGWSEGMTLVRFAQEMISLGAVRAMNLDGGGGTTMWVKNHGLVNRPSDWSGERPVCSAVLILPNGSDSTPVPNVTGLAALSGLTLAQIWNLTSADPASTGGLLSAMADGALGAHPSLPASLRRVAARFDSSHAR